MQLGACNWSPAVCTPAMASAADCPSQPVAKRSRTRPSAEPAARSAVGPAVAGAAVGLTMGSICSGMGTCHRAAELIQRCNPDLKIRSVFACEKDRAARKVLTADFPCLRLYNDACEDAAFLPQCDILTAGWPCQPFSPANRRRKGSSDARCAVLPHILDYIDRAKPRIVIMENVQGFLVWGRECAHELFHRLRSAGYHIGAETLNARIHGGLPQNRRRLYIVAVRAPSSDLVWPCAIAAKSLPAVLSADAAPAASRPQAPKAREKLIKVERQLRAAGATQAELPHMVANCHSQLGALFIGCTPCLTAARGAQGGFWLLGRNRMMTVPELLRLQGHDPGSTRIADTVSKRQAGILIGNSFTLPVVGRVLVSALRSVGVAVVDPFAA